MKLYLCDNNMIYTGKTVEYDEASKLPLPPRAIDVVPPKGIAKWIGNKWITLNEYPAPPAPIVHPEKTKDELKAEYEASGLLKAIEDLIDERIALAPKQVEKSLP